MPTCWYRIFCVAAVRKYWPTPSCIRKGSREERVDFSFWNVCLFFWTDLTVRQDSKSHRHRQQQTKKQHLQELNLMTPGNKQTDVSTTESTLILSGSFPDTRGSWPILWLLILAMSHPRKLVSVLYKKRKFAHKEHTHRQTDVSKTEVHSTRARPINTAKWWLSITRKDTDT